MKFAKTATTSREGGFAEEHEKGNTKWRGMSRPIVFAFGFLFCTLFSSFATASDLYVDSNATAGGNGTAAAPYQTIQEAVNAAEDGATIPATTGTSRTGAARRTKCGLRYSPPSRSSAPGCSF